MLSHCQITGPGKSIFFHRLLDRFGQGCKWLKNSTFDPEHHFQRLEHVFSVVEDLVRLPNRSEVLVVVLAQLFQEFNFAMA